MFIFKTWDLSEEIQGFKAEIPCPKTALKTKENKTKNKTHLSSNIHLPQNIFLYVESELFQRKEINTSVRLYMKHYLQTWEMEVSVLSEDCKTSSSKCLIRHAIILFKAFYSLKSLDY